MTAETMTSIFQWIIQLSNTQFLAGLLAANAVAFLAGLLTGKALTILRMR